MTNPPQLPWIHIGECPVCVNGICRVRTCIDSSGKHFYALCDECEALWLSPDTNADKQFPEAENPSCPICSQPLYGSQANWTRAEDLADTDWAEQSIFEMPTKFVTSDRDDVLASQSPTQDAKSADIPAEPSSVDCASSPPEAPAPIEAPSSIDAPTAIDAPDPIDEQDESYGQDDPKPGC